MNTPKRNQRAITLAKIALSSHQAITTKYIYLIKMAHVVSATWHISILWEKLLIPLLKVELTKPNINNFV